MDNVKSFLNYLKVYKNYSELTIKNYYNDLTEFSLYIKKDLTRVKKEDIKSYLKYLFDKDNSNRTVSRKISTLKSFYKYLKENDVIKSSPALSIKYPKADKKLPNFVHYNELESMINATKKDTFYERDDSIIELMYATGVRVSELVNIKLDDIDFEKETINIQHNVYDKPKDGKGRWYMGTTKTKNGVRQIYMSPTLFQALINFKKKQQHLKKLYGSKYITYYFEDVIGKNGKLIERRIIENNGNILHMNIANLVFTRLNGKYVGRNILNYPFKIIHKELGIKDCRFYDLRGSYATTNLRNGVEIRDVADILGHKYIETTENFYISSTEQNKKDVTTAFDKVMTSELINDIIKYEIAY